MSKSKISFEEKLQAVQRYKHGEGSQESIAAEIGVDSKTFRQWIANYDSLGGDGLRRQNMNTSYSIELKEAAVTAYKNGEGSQFEICKRFKIRSPRQLRNWISCYNSHKELRATGGVGKGIYMTKGRKITLDERIEIVAYCFEHGKNYAKTIEKYNVSYQQIYSWVKKYEAEGVDGLADRRGRNKPLEEMTKLEKAQAEIRMLKAEKADLELENALLKKVKELERRRGWME